MADNLKLTRYQTELLQLVQTGVQQEGVREDIDFDQLIDTLSWKPTKASAHFSIRALVKRRLLKKNEGFTLRRGRQRVTFSLTGEGQAILDPRKPLEEATHPLPGLLSETELSLLPGLDELVV